MPLVDRDREIEGELKIIFYQADLEDVMKYFVGGFDRDIHKYEWLCDPVKGKVVFKLYVEKTEEDV